jgi:hypothetical protein
MKFIEEYQVIPKGRGGKVTLSFPSGMVITCKKRSYPILVIAEHTKKCSCLSFKKIDETFNVDDLEGLVDEKYRGTDEQEAIQEKRKK